MRERLQYLFERFVAGTCTPAEYHELMGLVLEPSLQSEVQELVWQAWEQTGEENDIDNQHADTLLDDILTAPVVTMPPFSRRRGWIRWIAAASVIILLGITSYFLFFEKKDTPGTIPVIVATDVQPPQTNRAMITLTNGRKVALDSLTMTSDGAVRVSKNNKGEIIYDGSTEEVVYNMLDNPRGSPVTNITLIDGTKVWLNAASSLKYFASNAGNERRVEITGEAYFEVAKDVTRPFIVKKGETKVTVLGTHFNVNAYDDEGAVKVTLLEGSVNVNGTVIRPGQQATVTGIVEVHHANIDEVMGWKEGVFHFESADMPAVLRQFSRWYDVDVVYEGTPSPEKYFVIIKRESTLSSVLNALQASDVKFTINGRTLTVKK